MVKRYKILLVDDIAENIQTLTSCLEELHPEYILYQATSGKSAIELANNLKIDLIVSDWDMPGMSGIDMVTQLKANPRTCNIPVIIVTGIMLSSLDLNIALSAGAYDYLRKPVERVELAARTNAAIQYVEMHLKELAVKNLELIEKTVLLTRHNQFNIEIANRLKQLSSIVDDNPEAKMLINEIQDDIDIKTKKKNWNHFEMAFQNVHPEFNKNIVQNFPCLTPAELRHCILIRLGMNTKDMASILYQNAESIKVTRSRIRKKLQIDNETNLQSFLCLF
jgi:CheY-like chemotaxis protein/DNA-binding CsgD family transcriptional regulator